MTVTGTFQMPYREQEGRARRYFPVYVSSDTFLQGTISRIARPFLFLGSSTYLGSAKSRTNQNVRDIVEP